jgi:hypothetical protein
MNSSIRPTAKIIKQIKLNIMKEKETILRKLLQARINIAKTEVKKAGHNTFSDYHYFTPEQVQQLVLIECEKLQMITLYQLQKENEGYTATLNLVCLESMQHYLFSAPTEVPDIKATNVAQKLGGTMTYSHRYLLMFAFDIARNTLDFDSQKPTESKPKQTETKPEQKPKITEWMSEIQFKNYCKRIEDTTLVFDLEELKAELNNWSVAPKGMKKEYKEKLRELLTQK